jgi:hypothetical protein
MIGINTYFFGIGCLANNAGWLVGNGYLVKINLSLLVIRNRYSSPLWTMITWFVPANNCSVVIRLGGSGLTTIDLASVFFIMVVRILLINWHKPPHLQSMRIKNIITTVSKQVMTAR